MRLIQAIVALSLCLVAWPQQSRAEDARYLTRVESPVMEASGDHQAITRRALTCIAQLLTPGVVDAPSVRSSDIEAGTIVATNSFHYTYGLLQVTGRTTLTFEARDGPFRVTHTNIEQLLDANQGWRPIGTWRFSGGDAAKAAIEGVTARLAQCVQSAPSVDTW